MIRTQRRAPRLEGEVDLPGDKSISHRYAMLAAISQGTTELRRFATSRDCDSTLRCLETLGVGVRRGGRAVTIEGRGLRGLRAPTALLDAGNSGTTLRLLAGILAGHAFRATLTGDESLSRRPMGRILDPLSRMGARIEACDGGLPPVTIEGGALHAVRYTLPVASAQVKSCVLLAGLYGDGPTAVEERIPTRDHTEIALERFGARVRREGDWIEVEPEPRLVAQRLDVPGDLSGAAFFLVASLLVPDSDLVLRDVGLNRRRRELVDYLKRAGARITIGNERASGGEARGDLHIRNDGTFSNARLEPISGNLVAALIDEIPALAVLGSQTAGGLEISGAAELRVKESDRIGALGSNLRAMGADVEERPDGLRVAGTQRLRGADIETRGDHRIAMAFAVAGLAASGETRIHGAESADVSFPGFYATLDAICGQAGTGARG